MKRIWLYIGLGLSALLLLCFLAFFWLFQTASGARFAVNAIAGAAGFHISIQGIEGRLLDRLHLTGVRISQPKLTAQIDRLDLTWQPRQLFNNKLLVQELAASGVRVQDDRPATTEPPQLRWPRVSGVLRRFSAQLSSLRVKDLSYRHLQTPPVLVTELSSSLAYQNGLLTASDLSLISSEGRVTGEIAAGLWHPSLRLDLAVVPIKPIQELDFFSVQTRLLPGRAPEQLSGAIAVAGRSGGAQRLELTGELGIEVHALNLRKLKISRPGRRGTVTGTASMKLTKPEPLFSLALKATDLDLAKELQLPTSLSGTVNFTGSMADFQGDFALTNRGPGWQSAFLAANFKGGPTGVKLAPLTGKLLDGTLRGALDILWGEGLRISGQLAGRGLNPGKLAAEWSGLVNLDLAGNLDIPEQGPLKGKLRGKLLESHLQGKDLQGELVAAFAGQSLRVDRLFLRGKGFNLHGAGELDKRLNLVAKVTDLSGLVPGAAGQLQADGWLRWRDGLLSAAANGQGRNLAVDGMSAAALRFDARLGEGKGYPVYLDASIKRLRTGRFQAEDALLTLQGTVASHTLTAQLSSPGSAKATAGLPSSASTKTTLNLPASTKAGVDVSVSAPDFASATADRPAFGKATGTKATAGLPSSVPDSAKVRSEVRLALAGGYADGVWRGELTRFSGRDSVGPWSLAAPAPLVLSAERLRVASLRINGVPGERIELSADLNLKPLTGNLNGTWSGLNLARANAWLSGMELAGGSSGDLSLRLLPGERVILAGRAEAHGTVIADGKRFDLERLTATLAGDRDGLRAELDLFLEQGAGEAHLLFNSPDPAVLGLPQRGDLTLRWSAIDLALLRPVSSPELVVQGRSAGLVRGKLLPGGKLDLKGDAALDQGHVTWRSQGDELDASIDTAQLGFSWRGSLTGAGKDDAGLLTLNGQVAGRGSYTARGERINFNSISLRADADLEGTRARFDLALEGGGSLRAAVSSDSPGSLAIPETGEFAVEWSAIDAALLKPWLPADANLLIEGRSVGEVKGKFLPGARVDLKGEASMENGRVNWHSQTDVLDASIDRAELHFSWRGVAPRSGRPAAGPGELTLNAQADATGSYTSNGQRIAFGNLTLRAEAGRDGTRANVDLALDKGGALRLAISSDSPASAGIPETGDLALEWGGIDAALLKPWLPGNLDLDGQFAGRAKGKLMPGKRFDLAGEAEFSQGRARWQGQTGEVNTNLRNATLNWNWRGETLSGALNMALAENGTAQGSFVLPIPARLPVVPDANGALRGELVGKVQERGFLTAFLPGLVQESHGELDMDLRLGGIWREPRLVGTLQLAKAGAYLPTAGIRVSDLQFTAQLEGDQIRIDNFRAVSGDGHIEGNLLVDLEGWQVAGYSGTLSGERFRTVYLPELQLVTSPQLSFDGGPDNLVLRGELRVPELLISGPPVRQVVAPSGDVILEGALPTTGEQSVPFILDGRIRVVLGDKVEVKASGIDAQLGGSMYLVLNGMDSISSSGEISVVKGRYRAYGMDLEIVRGRLYYVDDPVDQPTLDILALTTVGDVKAGVTVAGYLDAPIVKLYSEPPMPEVDILAYMVLGHPMGASSEQGSLLAAAAGSLFSLGESNSIQEQIKDRLGLSVLGVQTVNTSGAGLMGYKPVSTTAGGAVAQPIGESLLTVGKYLTPRLYLSYGRSLLTGANLFILRYDITKRWQLETQSGSESGVDIYYKVEFN